MNTYPSACGGQQLLSSYLLAKAAIVDAGYETELSWQEGLAISEVDARTFLREAAWVVLSSGMKECVIRGIFPSIEKAFGYWEDPRWIVNNAQSCKEAAMRVFKHERKLGAIVSISRTLSAMGVDTLMAQLISQGPDAFLELPFMGPATSRHLAKNLGLDVAKPDRHLVRVAEALGFCTPAALCELISVGVGDSIATVDLVIWRFATLCPTYIDFFSRPFHQGQIATSGAGPRGSSIAPAEINNFPWVV